MQRRDDLDRAKGLAILLVVFGHLVARTEPAGLTWYEPLRHAIYSFHMPFFLYLSGLAAGLADPARLPDRPWLVRRARRLLLPFLAFGVLTILGKLALARVMPVDHAPDGLLPALGALLWRTADSPAGSVWYLPVLFVFSAACPWLWRAAGNRWWLPGAGALALLAWPAPPVAYLDRIAGFAVFYVAGTAAARGGAAWLAGVDRHRRLWLLAFAGVLALILAGVLPDGRLGTPAERGVLLLAGLLAMPALHGAVRGGGLSRSRVLRAVGRASLPIYLFNTILIGLTKGLMLRALPWTAAAFPLFAAAMLATGIAGPMLMARGWALVSARARRRRAAAAWLAPGSGATAAKAALPQTPRDALPAP